MQPRVHDVAIMTWEDAKPQLVIVMSKRAKTCDFIPIDYLTGDDRPYRRGRWFDMQNTRDLVRVCPFKDWLNMSRRQRAEAVKEQEPNVLRLYEHRK